jgi:tetratricopeptide (TPR) repeat protein
LRGGSASLAAAIDFLARGDARAALAAASEACHDDPKVPEHHYAYGQAWLALADPARAEQAFAAALRLRPAWADAWVNYGLARYRQGAIEEAKIAMRQALAKAPGHAAATANLGAFMRISGEPAAAEALLRDTLVRDPANAGAKLNLAADLLQDERPAEALALLEPDDPSTDDIAVKSHWRLQRALALLQLGRGPEARRVLETLASSAPVPPALAPLWRWRLVLLALLEGKTAEAQWQAARMEESLAAMGAEAIPEHQIMARFDLAKFWDGQGDGAAAFRQWEQGHSLLRASQPFSRADHAAMIDATMARLDKNRFAGRPRASNTDPAPVFIVGMPRSGTTLCEQILAAHRDVHGAGERPHLAWAVAALAGRGDGAHAAAQIAELRSEALDRTAEDYLARLHALAPDKSRIVDKMPGNYMHLGLVGLMLPGARIIHCERDPRDIGLSIFTFRFHGHHAYAHDLADLGWTIARQVQLMDHWKATLPNPILTVRLSDWVDDFDGTLARILAHLDLPPDSNCARFHEAQGRVRTVSRAQVRQPVNARGLGRWRAYERELAPLIAALDEEGVLAPWRDARR